MKEHVLSINNFNMPKVYDKSDATYMLIVRLLLLEPGKFQSHPYMGIGLKSKYRYNNQEGFLQTLQNDIKNQMSMYLPQLSFTDITLTIKDRILGIIINTNDGAYVVAYDNDKNAIDAAATYILDNL